MNIKIVQNDLSRALQLAAAGKNIEAARVFVAVIRMAAKCRAKGRDTLQLTAAGCLAKALRRVLAESKDNAERSEAGRIRAEADAFFRSTGAQPCAN